MIITTIIIIIIIIIKNNNNNNNSNNNNNNLISHKVNIKSLIKTDHYQKKFPETHFSRKNFCRQVFLDKVTNLEILLISKFVLNAHYVLKTTLAASCTPYSHNNISDA